MLISTDQSQRVSQPFSQITLSQFRISQITRSLPSAVAADNTHLLANLLAPGKWAEMHENSNLFLFLIEINNMHRTRHIFQYPGPVFGAGADGAVFRDIVGKSGRIGIQCYQSKFGFVRDIVTA